MRRHARACVLIIDDDDVLRATLAALLREHRYDARQAADAKAAVAQLKRGGVDIVLLDLSMPGISGGELLHRLRRSEERPQVIVISADTALATRVRSLYGGATDYLTKPFESEELLACLAVARRQRLVLARATRISRTDPLTGIGNRAVFDAALSREAERALRRRRPLALVYIDADGLKRVNDAHGHEAGDELLRAIARSLSASCRATDVAARIGGDEFAVILPEAGRNEARAFVERLRKSLLEQMLELPDGTVISARASAGFAVLGEDAGDAASLRKAADWALYDAKESKQAFLAPPRLSDGS